MNFEDLKEDKTYGRLLELKPFEALTATDKKYLAIKKKDQNVLVTLQSGLVLVFSPEWNHDDRNTINKLLPIYFSEMIEGQPNFVLQKTAYNVFTKLYNYLCDNCPTSSIGSLSL